MGRRGGADGAYGEWQGDKELSFRGLGRSDFSTPEPVGLLFK